mmetsp:Transcript_276/g.295  ORF Transcript_276/g.295 Transcript_276/m.295 type:complete len:196 (+) Transcript_276:638-1225(+)
MDRLCDELITNIKDIYAPANAENTPKESRNILCLNPSCAKPGVKPTTVLYGRSLPESFFRAIEVDFPNTIDLLFVIGKFSLLAGIGMNTSSDFRIVSPETSGTSLTVGPANQIPMLTSPTCKRVIVNYDPIESGYLSAIRFRPDVDDDDDASKHDLFLQGDCDVIFHNLAESLGWIDSLRSVKSKMASKGASLLP